MKLSSYSPNIRDPRTKKKILSALEFATQYVNAVKPLTLHSNVKQQIFGNYRNKGSLAEWLVANLLVEAGGGHYITGEKSKQYVINTRGYQKLSDLLKVPTKFRTDIIISKYASELGGDKPFEYFDKTFRLWHPLQFETREDKKIIFPSSKGWVDFDISTALPSIFIQKHIELVNTRGFQNSYVINAMSDLPAISEYVRNKDKIRVELAELLSVDIIVIKKIINSLFLGAKLSPFYKCTIFRYLNQNEFQLIKLKSHPFIGALVKDIHKFWNTSYKWYNNARIKSGLECIPKNHLYFHFERQVLEPVDKLLRTKNKPFFHEHDGFKFKGKLNISEIKSVVEEQTQLVLDWD